MDGDDVFRVRGNVFDLLAQLRHVIVDGACQGETGVAPDVVQELITGDGRRRTPTVS